VMFFCTIIAGAHALYYETGLALAEAFALQGMKSLARHRSESPASLTSSFLRDSHASRRRIIESVLAGKKTGDAVLVDCQIYIKESVPSIDGMVLLGLLLASSAHSVHSCPFASIDKSFRGLASQLIQREDRPCIRERIRSAITRLLLGERSFLSIDTCLLDTLDYSRVSHRVSDLLGAVGLQFWFRLSSNRFSYSLGNLSVSVEPGSRRQVDFTTACRIRVEIEADTVAHWHHLAVSSDSERLAVYVNGSEYINSGSCLPAGSVSYGGPSLVDFRLSETPIALADLGFFTTGATLGRLPIRCSGPGSEFETLNPQGECVPLEIISSDSSVTCASIPRGSGLKKKDIVSLYVSAVCTLVVFSFAVAYVVYSLLSREVRIAPLQRPRFAEASDGASVLYVDDLNDLEDWSAVIFWMGYVKS